MNVNYITTLAKKYDSFEQVELKKTRLLAGSVVALVTDISEISDIIEDYQQRLIGVIIILGENQRIERISNNLIMIQTEEESLNELMPFIAEYISLIGNKISSETIITKQSIEIERSIRDLEEIRRDYNLALNSLTDKVRITSNLYHDISESERRFKEMSDMLPQVVFELDLRGNLKFVNQIAFEIFGYSREEFNSDINILNLVTKEDAIKVRERMNDMITGTYQGGNEYTAIRKNGSTFPVLIFSTPVYHKTSPVGFRGILIDISDRMAVDEVIRESEYKYRLIADNANDMISLMRDDGSYNYASPSCLRILGYTQEELYNKKVYDLIYPIDLHKVIKYFYDTKVEDGSIPLLFRAIKKDKSVIWLESIAKSLSIESSKDNSSLLIISRDVTDRVRSEEALKQSEENFRMLTTQLPLGVYKTSLDGKILFANNALVKMLGFNSYDDLAGFNIRDLYSNPMERDEQFVRMKKSPKSSYFQILKLKTKSGKEILVQDSFKPFLNEAGDTPYFIGILENITDKKKAEDEILRVSKLESIGILAGGIAHNIKNILANISFNTGLARLRKNDISTYLDRIDSAIEHATAIATRFHTFSTGGNPVFEVINIADFIQDAAIMALGGTNTSFTLDFPEGVKNIKGDWRQLNEVLTNIFLNASDAMPDGGRINITGENFINSEDVFPNLSEGSFIKISIRDYGTGIDKSIIENIFDPFFSTKDKNRGLGLASAHYIIQKHLGMITVESEPDQGSVFSIYLPSTDEPLSNPSREDLLSAKPNIQNRILFMDDEELLRDNMQDIGSLLDYEVVCASHGNEAVSIYERELLKGRRFDAVILDLTIQGGMQGDEAIKELLRIDPDVKAIVFSGHSSKPIVAHYQDYGFKGRLDKPVTIESLVKTLNEVINNS